MVLFGASLYVCRSDVPFIDTLTAELSCLCFIFFFSSKELKAWHRPQIECLAAAGADLVAFETIPSIKEAEALVELLREFPNSKAWLSFSCKVTIAAEQKNPF